MSLFLFPLLPREMEAVFTTYRCEEHMQSVFSNSLLLIPVVLGRMGVVVCVFAPRLAMHSFHLSLRNGGIGKVGS